jgi:aminopeptidase N
MFDDRVYKRGALTLHALRLTLGDEVFFHLLQGWAGDNAGGSVTTADFVEYASAAAATDLADLFRSWLDEEPLPDLPAAS